MSFSGAEPAEKEQHRWPSCHSWFVVSSSPFHGLPGSRRRIRTGRRVSITRRYFHESPVLCFSSPARACARGLIVLGKGISARVVTLFVFGGVAQIGREPDRPLIEL
jgi:hypothetical protein